MLRPLPTALLTDSAEFLVCTGVTSWQAPTWERVTVAPVHLQPTNEIRRGTTNAEEVQKAVLFVDGRQDVDLYDMMRRSEAAGHVMECVVTTAYGGVYSYNVVAVDALPDVPSTRVHHWEVALV